jgi:hypothetical protein
MLVAVAAVLADAALFAPDAVRTAAVETTQQSGRTSSPFTLSGRLLASALATVAETLEEDWHRPQRQLPTWRSGGRAVVFATGMGLPSAASLRLEIASASAAHAPSNAMRRPWAIDDRPRNARLAFDRRTMSLPPPAAC